MGFVWEFHIGDRVGIRQKGHPLFGRTGEITAIVDDFKNKTRLCTVMVKAPSEQNLPAVCYFMGQVDAKFLDMLDTTWGSHGIRRAVVAELLGEDDPLTKLKVSWDVKPKPTIVCLCGSTKFKDEFTRAQLEETLAGKIVLTIGCNMKSDNDIFGI